MGSGIARFGWRGLKSVGFCPRNLKWQGSGPLLVVPRMAAQGPQIAVGLSILSMYYCSSVFVRL